MAITEYYISAAGGGAHDGTSEANAWTLSEAITANNALGAGGAAGRRYNIKGAHTGRGATDTISVGGSATSPAIWRGYNSTIGDLDAGTRDAYGALDTTNYPDIGYNSTFRLTVTATHVVMMNLDVAGTITTQLFYMQGNLCVVQNCRSVNSSTNATATAFTFTGGTQRCINCDGATAGSGGKAAFDVNASATYFVGCRAVSTGAVGFLGSGSNVGLNVTGCTAYGCTDGFATSHASASIIAFHCTSQGNSSDGIDIISTSTGILHTIVGCHITDNGAYAINFNGGTSGGLAVVTGNRYRDNTSGDVTGYADWSAGTVGRVITTDTGAAATDYVDAATNKDFRLISTAAGYRQGFAYNANIGACGDNVSASGGSVGVIGG